MHTTGPALTPAAILRNENDTIDLSSDDDLADDALELLIKSRKEAEIFNDLPLFDVDILNKFIDEWFDSPNLSFDDLQLPIGLSVSFHGAIAPELALAQKIVELKHKIDYEKAQFKKHMAKLSVTDVQNFKTMLHELKEAFHKKREEAKGSRERMKLLAAKCVQAYNEAEKRKALGCPGIDPKMSTKQKKPVVDQAEPSRREEPRIVFPASMTGVKPKVPIVASELQKTRAAEAKARKRKTKNTPDDAPPTKKRKTKKRDRAAPTEPLVVEPISVARPASAHQERRMIVHEPASIEAPEAEDIPAVDPTVAEDIGQHDNVEDDEALPQIEQNVVSSPVLTNSELISIGRPLTPIA